MSAPKIIFLGVAIAQPDGTILYRPGPARRLDLLTTRQFATMCGLTQRRVQQLCAEGKLRARQHADGRKILIPGQELQKFIDFGEIDEIRERPIQGNGLKPHP